MLATLYVYTGPVPAIAGDVLGSAEHVVFDEHVAQSGLWASCSFFRCTRSV